MQQYAYRTVNGYPIANIRGRQYLLDTGTPFTVGSQPLVIDGELIEVRREVLGITSDKMSEFVGCRLDGILGANLTDRFVVRIDPVAESLVLDQYLDTASIEIEVINLGGLPSVRQTVAGRQIRAFLFLGSHLSWVSADTVADREPVAYDREYFSFTGEIHTPVYHLPVLIGRQRHDMRFGVMPPEIQAMVDMANVSALIGSELLDHYRLSLSMQEELLLLDPLVSDRTH